MTKAIVANEQQMKDTEYTGYDEYPEETEYPFAPNASERMHVGSKTPVLGSMDLVTGNQFLFNHG